MEQPISFRGWVIITLLTLVVSALAAVVFLAALVVLASFTFSAAGGDFGCTFKCLNPRPATSPDAWFWIVLILAVVLSIALWIFISIKLYKLFKARYQGLVAKPETEATTTRTGLSVVAVLILEAVLVGIFLSIIGGINSQIGESSWYWPAIIGVAFVWLSLSILVLLRSNRLVKYLTTR